jgi:hypothetical protein
MTIEDVSSSLSDKEYNKQLDVIESLYEFHPEFFDELSPELQAAAQAYYLLGKETPDNVFEYRLSLLRRDPTLESKAKEAYSSILRISSQASS